MSVWKSLSETVFYSSLLANVLVMVSIFHKLPVSSVLLVCWVSCGYEVVSLFSTSQPFLFYLVYV